MSERPSVNTRMVGGRRQLHFDRVDNIIVDAEAVAAAERDGTLRQLGNWTPGQTFGHLAGWIDYSYDGIPIKIPWFIRLLAKPIKHRFIHKPMGPGGKIPGVPGGTVATELLSTEDGLARLRKACERLKSQAPTQPHPIFGPLTHEQWIELSLRHAELHLSFLAM